MKTCEVAPARSAPGIRSDRSRCVSRPVSCPPIVSSTETLRSLIRMYARFCGFAVLLGFASVCSTECAWGNEATDDEAMEAVHGFLKSYCWECHSDARAEGDLSLQSLNAKEMERDVSLWEEVVSRLESANMPPETAKHQPTSAQRREIVQALRTSVENARERVDERRPFALRRLNRREYSNSLRAVLGIEWDPSPLLPMDDALYGFDNVAEGLQLSTLLAESYLEIARGAIDRALRFDPKPEVRRWQYHLGDAADFPEGSSSFGLYNGNAHMTFGKKLVYIGGPALFSEVFPYPPHRFMYEGKYRWVARLTPRNFPDNAVASFRIDGPKGMVDQRDCAVQNGRELVLETTFYYDRDDECLRSELNWTNGHHLSWPVRSNPKKDQYFNYWWLVNYRESGGKREDWRPQSASELPFGYFENVKLEISGPHWDAWPPKETSDWFGPELGSRDPESVLKPFLTRCFRRDVDQDEVQQYVERFFAYQRSGMEPLDAYKQVFAIALTSPDFLFLLPSPNSGPDVRRCDGFELASRLSYFLWSAPPDETLMQLARTGQLLQPEVLSEQAARMLRDARAREFKTHFVRQWLRLDKLSSVMPEPKLFPFYSEALRDAMREETLLLMRDVIDQNLPLSEWLGGDWTYVNEKLADHYGIAGIDGDGMRRVSPVPESRGSLFAHASILTMTSEATRTSPVLRGKWILDCLFHRPPPAPPPNVSSLQPDASSAKTPKEHLLIHKQMEACAGCHARIDPYGLILENYDAIGQWRTTELPWEDPGSAATRSGDAPPPSPIAIDTNTQFADGEILSGPAEFKRYLLDRQDAIAVGFTEQLMIYALGRGLRQSDRKEAQRIAHSAAADGFRFHALIQGIVTSENFRTRPQTLPEQRR